MPQTVRPADAHAGAPRGLPGYVLLVLGIAAVLLPPLAVAIKRGVFTTSWWLSVLLTLIGWLPGQVYALYVVCVKPLSSEAAA